MRYVVLVKPPDDHPAAVRIYGTYRDRERAEAMCKKVRDAADASAESLDETYGYAYVIPVRKPRLREAILWAARGEQL